MAGWILPRVSRVVRKEVEREVVSIDTTRIHIDYGPKVNKTKRREREKDRRCKRIMNFPLH